MMKAWNTLKARWLIQGLMNVGVEGVGYPSESVKRPVARLGGVCAIHDQFRIDPNI